MQKETTGKTRRRFKKKLPGSDNTGRLELSQSEIIEKISDSPESNYMSLIITPWHELSFEASLLYIENKHNLKPKGITVIRSHGAADYALSDEALIHNQNAVYEKRDTRPDLEKRIRNFKKMLLSPGSAMKRGKNKDPFFLFTFLFLSSSGANLDYYFALRKKLKRRKIILVVIDEGLGAYIDDAKGWMRKTQNSGRSNRGIIKPDFTKMFLQSLKKSGAYINCNLFSAENNCLKLNRLMAENYKKTIRRKAAGMPEIKMPEKYVLVNTQPFTADEENGIDMDILRVVAESFQKLGFLVFLKPHPRENDIERYKKLDVVLMQEAGTAQEVLFERFDKKPEYIISYFSTSLVTAKVFYGINAISLAPMLLKKDGLKAEDRKRLLKFLETFGEYVSAVDDIQAFADKTCSGCGK